MNKLEEIRKKYKRDIVPVDATDWQWLISTLGSAHHALDAIESDVCGFKAWRITQSTYIMVLEVLQRIRGLDEKDIKNIKEG